MKRNSAFTLVELLVVIVIIGILSSISIGLYRGYFKQAREMKILAQAEQIEKNIMKDALKAKKDQFLLMHYGFNNVGEGRIYDLGGKAPEQTFTPSADRMITDETSIDGEGSLFIKETGGFSVPLQFSHSQNFTISAFVKWNDIPPASYHILNIGNNASGDQIGFAASWGGSAVDIQVRADNIQVSNRKDIDLDVWYHLMVSHDGDKVDFYIDGELFQSIDPLTPLSFGGTQNIYFGSSNPTFAFNGYYDRVKILPGAYIPD